MSGRLVIVACGYAFNEFVGFDCYDVDNECFCVIWAKDISKHKIWGIDKGKIKELPTLSCERDCYIQGFENCKLLRGYRNLPCIDVRTGTAYNINNCVVVSKYVSEGLTYYKCVCYNNKQVGIFEASKLREMILGNNIYFCNLKKCSDRISPLGKSFYSDKSILNKLLLLKGKLSPVKYIGELEKLQQHSNQEAKKDIERRTSVILKDVSRYDKEKGSLAELDKKNRAYFVSAVMSASDVMLPELQKLGLNDINKRKAPLKEVVNYIDSSSFLDELDNFVQYPCTDEYCKSLVENVKRLYINAGERRESLSKRYFLKLVNSKFREKLKSVCSCCYSMKSMYVMAQLWRIKAEAFVSTELKDNLFVDVSTRKIFSLLSFFISIHEYMHYLSSKEKEFLSGFTNKMQICMSDKILNEGFTDLLACYFTEYILRRTNNSNLVLLLNDSPVRVADYDIIINPFLRNLYELKDSDLSVLQSKALNSIIGYKYNVCLVLYILSLLPVNKVLNMYFNADRKGFYTLCENKFGEDVWSKFIEVANIIKSENGKLRFDEYSILIDILKDRGDSGVK